MEKEEEIQVNKGWLAFFLVFGSLTYFLYRTRHILLLVVGLIIWGMYG